MTSSNRQTRKPDIDASLNGVHDPLQSMPFSDWVRIWLTLPARHLPRSLALELQLSISKICVQAASLIGPLGALAVAILSLQIVRLDTWWGQVWVLAQLIVYIVTFVTVFLLRRDMRNGRLTAKRVNLYLLPAGVVSGVLMGLLPTVVSTTPVSVFYVAVTITIIAALVGPMWAMGHWPLSLSHALAMVFFLNVSVQYVNSTAAPLFLRLTPVFVTLLVLLTAAGCIGITSSRYHEVSAKEREKLINLLLQDYERGGQDFLWEADADLRFVQVPRRMVNAAKGDPRVAIGGSLKDLLKREADAEHALLNHEAFQTLVQTEGPDGMGQLRLWGQPRHIMGRRLGYRGVGTDEAATRRAQEAERKSERLDAMVELTGGLAHDFNNQLASVLGAVELAALDPQLSERTGNFLRRAIEACMRTRRITSDLVVAAGHDASYRPEPVDISEAAREVSVDIFQQFPDVRVSFSGHDDAWANTDKSQFMRAIHNLAQNACESIIESGDSDGTVTLTVSVADDEVRKVLTTVGDNGPGVDPKIREKIFEPFVTSRRASGGSGLGLSVAQGFARQASGSLELLDDPNSTVFGLYLPAIPTPAVVVNRKTKLPATELPRLSGRFVIVEDDPDVAENLLAWIDSVGGIGEIATTVREAIDRFAGQTDEIECVISDIILPDGEGFEVIEALRDQDPDVRGVYMSGFTHTMPSSLNPRLDCPFVPKPFSSTELVEALHQAGVPIGRAPKPTS